MAKRDSRNGLSEYFEHDFANRLKRWRVEQKVNLSCRGGILEYGYDDAGNLTSRTVVGGAGTNVANGYGPQAMLSAGVNALTSTTEGTAPTTRFRYDAAGNQTDVFHHRAPSSPTDVGDKRLTWTHFSTTLRAGGWTLSDDAEDKRRNGRRALYWSLEHRVDASAAQGAEIRKPR